MKNELGFMDGSTLVETGWGLPLPLTGVVTLGSLRFFEYYGAPTTLFYGTLKYLLQEIVEADHVFQLQGADDEGAA